MIFTPLLIYLTRKGVITPRMIITFLLISLLMVTTVSGAYYTSELHTKYYKISITPKHDKWVSLKEQGINISITGTDCANDLNDIAIVYNNVTKKSWNFTNPNQDRISFIANDLSFTYNTLNEDYALYCNTTNTVSRTGAFRYLHDFDDATTGNWDATGGTLTSDASVFRSTPNSLKWSTGDSTFNFVNLTTQTGRVTIDFMRHVPTGATSQHCNTGVSDTLDAEAFPGDGSLLYLDGGSLRWYFEGASFITMSATNDMVQGQWGHYNLDMDVAGDWINITTNAGNNYSSGMVATTGWNYFRGGASANGVLCYFDDVYVSNTPFRFSNASISLGSGDTFSPTNSAPTHAKPILNATDHPTNSTIANLTVYNQSTADADGDIVKNIYNWYINNQSFAIINFPFEGGSQSGIVSAYVKNATRNYGFPFTDNITVKNMTYNASFGYNNSGSYKFDGRGCITFREWNSTEEFSLSAWVFDQGGQGFDIFQMWYDAGNSLKIFTDSSRRPNFRISNTPSGDVTLVNTSIGGCAIGSWCHVAVTYTNLSRIIYQNGVKVANDMYTGPYPASLGDYSNIGSCETTTSSKRGYIDEVLVFNRSLSKSQIYALYKMRYDLIVSDETTIGQNWSVNITPNDLTQDGSALRSNIVEIENVNPTITILSPPNNHHNTTTKLNVWFNVTDPDGENNFNATLYLNGVANATKSFSGSSTQQINSSTLSDGTYLWILGVTDGAMQSNTTATNYTVDTTIPSITFRGFSTDNLTFFIPQEANITLNEMCADANLMDCELSIYENATNKLKYQRNQTDIHNTTYNFTDTIDISQWGGGKYYLNLSSIDDITNSPPLDQFLATPENYEASKMGLIQKIIGKVGEIIGLPGIPVELNSVTFKDAKEGIDYSVRVQLLSDKGEIIETTDKNLVVETVPNDAYTELVTSFCIDKPGAGESIQFTYESNNEETFRVRHYENGHFVIGKKFITHEKDLAYFENIETQLSPDAKKVTVILKRSDYPADSTFCTHSQLTGGLNFVEKTVLFDIYTAQIGYFSPFPETLTAPFNLTLNGTGIVSANATLYYNGTAFNSTQIVSGSVITFNASPTAPLVLTNITLVPFYWTWNITRATDNITNTTGTLNSNTTFGFTLDQIILASQVFESELLSVFARLHSVSPTTATPTVLMNYSGVQYNYSSRSSQAFSDNFNDTFTFQINAPLINDPSQVANITIGLNLTYNGRNLFRNYLFVNQTIFKFTLTNCSSSTVSNTTSINITMRNEETNELLITDLDTTFQVFSANRSSFRNYSFDFNNNTAYQVCLFPANVNLTADAIMHYSAGTLFSSRNHYLINFTLSNTTHVLDLYSMNASATTTATITVVDENDEPVGGAYVKTLRYYPAENLYRVVEVSKTDTNGLTTAKVQLNERFYKFLIQRDGNTYLESVVAQIVQSTINFQIQLVGGFLDTFKRVGTVDSNLNYQNTTQSFTFTFTDTRNIVQDAHLKVFERSLRGEREVCSQSIGASSGTLVCTLTGNLTGTYVATGYIESTTPFSSHPLQTLEVNFGRTLAVFGLSGLLMALMIILPTFFMGITKPAIAIMYAILGVIVTVAVGFTVLSYGAVLFIAIIGLWYVYARE